MQAAGRAAGFAAVGLAAGVLMSALAVDLTDATVASAIFAAGLPSCPPLHRMVSAVSFEAPT